MTPQIKNVVRVMLVRPRSSGWAPREVLKNNGYIAPFDLHHYADDQKYTQGRQSVAPRNGMLCRSRPPYRPQSEMLVSDLRLRCTVYASSGVTSPRRVQCRRGGS